MKRKDGTPTKEQLVRENGELRARLEEAEEALRAIREGEVDALIVSGSKGDRVFSLMETENLHRLMVETMNEVGLAVAPDGVILFGNYRAREMFQKPLEELLGRSIADLVLTRDIARITRLLGDAREGNADDRIVFIATDGAQVPMHVWASPLNRPDGDMICLVGTDVSRFESDQWTINELQRQKKELREARIAALNLMEDSVEARLETEGLNAELQNEVAERRQAEKSLRESETRFRLALKNAPVSIAAQDRDLRFTYAYNQKSVPPEEVVGKKDADIFPPGDAERLKVLKRRVIATGEEHRESLWLTVNGLRMYLDVCLEPLRDEAGNITGVGIATVDLTAMKLSEEELRRSNERFSLLASTAGTLLLAPDAQAVVESLCRGVMEHLHCHVFFNYLADQEAGRLHLNAYAGIPVEEARAIEWLEYGSAVCGCAARDGCRIVAERIGDTPDPRTELVKSYGIRAYACHPLMGAGADIIGTLSFGTRDRDAFSEDDLALMKAVADQVATALIRMESEEKLRGARDYLDSLIDFASAPIIVWDPFFRITRFNHAFEELTGLTAVEVIGRDVEILFPESNREGSMSFIRGAQSGDRWVDLEIPIRGSDGSAHTVLWNSANIRDRGGEIVSTIAQGVDITERRNREAELGKLNRTLLALSKSSMAMTHAQDEAEYMREVCGIVVQDCGYSMVWIGFAEEDDERSVRPVAYSGFEAGYLETLNVTWADNERGRGPTGTAVRTGTISRCNNMLTDPSFAPWRDEALKRGYASSIVFPLKSEGKTFGALTIYSPEPDSFTGDEERLLSELADDLAHGITAIRLRADRDAALRELTQTLEATTEGIWKWNMRTGEAFYSPRYYTMLGYEPDEFPARFDSWEELLHPDDKNAALGVIERFLGSGNEVYNNEFRLRSRDGNYRVIRARGRVAERDTAGKALWLIGNHEDITEEQDVRLMLKEANQLLGTIIDNTDLLIAYMDNDFNILRVNRAFARAEGKGISYFAGRNYLALYPGGDAERMLHEVIETGTPRFSKAKVRAGASPEEEPSYWDLSVIPIRRDEGPVRSLVVTLVDVTMHKKAEEELIRFNEKLELLVSERTAQLSVINENLKSEIEQRYRLEAEKEKLYRELDTIFNSTSVGMTVIDRNNTFIMANKRFYSILSLEGSVVGKKCHELLPTGLCQTDKCPIARILAGEKECEYELAWKPPQGGEIILHITTVPYYSDTGEITGVIRNIIDITEKRDIQRRLIGIIDEERNKISHELHDGLGQNLTAAGFIIESIRQRFSETAPEAVARLDDIGEIVRQSQIQTRHLSQVLSPVEMGRNGLTASLERMASSFIKIFGIRVPIVLDDGFAVEDNNAATNLFYIAREAVNNAVKHGNPRCISIHLEADEGSVGITVQDDGTGAAKEATDPGLGLKIMKHRSEIIGAAFNAENVVDGGFRVTVRLPR